MVDWFRIFLDKNQKQEDEGKAELFLSSDTGTPPIPPEQYRRRRTLSQLKSKLEQLQGVPKSEYESLGLTPEEEETLTGEYGYLETVPTIYGDNRIKISHYEEAKLPKFKQIERKLARTSAAVTGMPDPYSGEIASPLETVIPFTFMLSPGLSATPRFNYLGEVAKDITAPGLTRVGARIGQAAEAPFAGAEWLTGQATRGLIRGVGGAFKGIRAGLGLAKQKVSSVLDILESKTAKGAIRVEVKATQTAEPLVAKAFEEIQTGKPFAQKLYRGHAEGADPNDIGWFGKGEYWSDKPEIAQFYAERQSGRVLEQSIELKNPYVLEEAVGDKYLTGIAERARVAARKAGKLVDEAEEVASEAIPKALKRRGHDGLIIKTREGDLEVVRYAEITKAKVKGAAPGVKPAEVAPPTMIGATRQLTFDEVLASRATSEQEFIRLISDWAEKPARAVARLKKKYGTMENAYNSIRATAEKATTEIPVPQRPVVGKIKQLIRSSEEQWEPTEIERAVERGIRASKLREALQMYRGGEAFKRGLATQKGALPIKEPLGAKLKPAEREELEQIIHNAYLNDRIREWESVHAWEGLQSILQARIPGMSRLVALEKVFGEDIISAILSKRAFWQRSADILIDTILLPRRLMTSVDWSAVAMQGGYLAPSHPVKAINAFGRAAHATFDKNYFNEVVQAVSKRPLSKIGEDHGLYLATQARAAIGLGAREEQVMSKAVVLKWGEKIPVLGKLFKGVTEALEASERAFTGYLDLFRTSIFDGTLQKWGVKSTTKITPELSAEITKLARYVNWATGRGWLPKDATVLLNAVMFSPRLQTSTIGLPFLISKMLISDSPALRAIAARDLAAFAGATATALTLAKLGGAEVEMDWRSTDFGQAKLGNTRINLLGRFKPYGVLIGRMLSGDLEKGETKTATGRIRKTSREQLLINFVRTKAAPVVGMLWNIIAGKTMVGDEVNFEAENMLRDMRESLAPLSIQAFYDAIEDEGWTGALKAMPEVIGVPVQTYDSAAQAVGDVNYYYSQRQLANQELAEMGLRKEFDKIPKYMEDHPEIFYGQTVSGAYTQINRLEQYKKRIDLDPDIPDETKKEMLKNIELQQIEIAVPALLAVDQMKLRRELEKAGFKRPTGEEQPIELPKLKRGVGVTPK